MSGRVPFLPAREHGVEDADQLAHAGHEGDLGFLALGDEALVASLEHRVMQGRRAHDRHEQQLPQLMSSTLDVAFTSPLATVIGEGSHSEQSRSSLAIDEAELGQEGDEACRGSPGQAWHLSLIHISEPTRLLSISYAVFCLKKKKKHTTN